MAPATPAEATAIPNLANVITSDDVSTKGTGTYKADYINWARVAHLLHEHAPGWQFHLTEAPDGGHIWRAPNGTGYVVGHFSGPGGQITPDFPQAVMDNRNAAVPMERIGARDITDTHRRCLCTAAAATFGLAWQLWGKEEIENPHREERPARPATDRQMMIGAAVNRCKEAGLTPAGFEAMVAELGKGQAVTIEQLPDNVLRRLGTTGAQSSSIARWNGEEEPPIMPPLADASVVRELAEASA